MQFTTNNMWTLECLHEGRLNIQYVFDVIQTVSSLSVHASQKKFLNIVKNKQGQWTFFYPVFSFELKWSVGMKGFIICLTSPPVDGPTSE